MQRVDNTAAEMDKALEAVKNALQAVNHPHLYRHLCETTAGRGVSVTLKVVQRTLRERKRALRSNKVI